LSEHRQARIAEELRIERENQSRELRNMLFEEEYQALQHVSTVGTLYTNLLSWIPEQTEQAMRSVSLSAGQRHTLSWVHCRQVICKELPESWW